MQSPSVTYVVMEGLGLTGVLACLPSVWSRTIQIPEYAEMERREVRRVGRERGERGGQRLPNTAIQANV